MIFKANLWSVCYLPNYFLNVYTVPSWRKSKKILSVNGIFAENSEVRCMGLLFVEYTLEGRWGFVIKQ